MSINYNVNDKTFTLDTDNSTYQMKVGPYGYLFHSYYGKKIKYTDMSYLFTLVDSGFSGNPYEADKDRTFSLDLLPHEFSFFGLGDFRNDCMQCYLKDGSCSVDFRYHSHEIRKGKYGLKGLPAMYGSDDEWSTLEVKMKEKHEELYLTLYYGVFAKRDIITRAARFENKSTNPVTLKRFLSICLEFYQGTQYDLITFHGRHCCERMLDRRPIYNGIQGIESVRGSSSHQYNPFVCICSKNADEFSGCCYGASFVYSGNYIAQVEKTQRDAYRLVMGIHPTRFCFEIKPGDEFIAPEVVLTYAQGFQKMSDNYHKGYRHNLCRGKFKLARRPVLINNWEGTYFNFNTEKLIQIAKNAAEIGIEMLVMDDGWFGKRDDDLSGLGDWVVNEKKLDLKRLASEVHKLGMKFGIWFEPEMVSEDSDLYRAHPEWVLKVPGRDPQRSRYQLVLDFSNKQVVDHIYGMMTKVLKSAEINYVKWDSNRHLSDIYSTNLPPERQDEVYHRHILGIYDILERINKDFPDIFVEGCSGGGGRFDPGMLYYHPQIWTSDNTDAAERLKIQYGTSFCYPVSCMGSHVSAVPNHQTGRTSSLNTRGILAMSGTFGYELDTSKLTPDEKKEIKKQIEDFKKYYNLIQDGTYYRLSSPFCNCGHVSWQFVSEDKKQTLVNVVTTHAAGNPLVPIVKLAGLCPDKMYELTSEDGKKTVYSGSALMNGGIYIGQVSNDYVGKQYYFAAKD